MTTSNRSRSRVYVLMQFLLIAIFAVAVFVDPAPAVLSPPQEIRSAGSALCAIGVFIIVAGFAAMGRVMQVWPEPKAGGHLVTRGVYRYLRHPMYTGIVLMALGLAARRPTFAVAAAGVALVILLLRKARFEESLLVQRYPDYTEYRRHTWGVIPGIR